MKVPHQSSHMKLKYHSKRLKILTLIVLLYLAVFILKDYIAVNVQQSDKVRTPRRLIAKFFQSRPWGNFTKPKKFIKFGKEEDHNCNVELGPYCRIKGRLINKYLIPESPSDMFTSLPKTFLKEFKNPCWRAMVKDRKSLLCMPYFYIIGFTKCGTTDLYFVLKMHKYISARSNKETHYIERKRRGRDKHMKEGVQPMLGPTSFLYYLNSGIYRHTLRETYLRPSTNRASPILFHGITMDATPSYVWDNEFWEYFHPQFSEPPVTNAELIYAINPGARIIISLRDPIKRMESAYQYFCAYSVYKCKAKSVTADNFHKLVVEAVDLMEECFRVNSVRSCVYSTATHQLETHLYASIYSVYLKDWLDVFPREQVFVTSLEDMAVNQISVIQDIFKFLDVPTMSENEIYAVRQHEIRNKLDDKRRLSHILPETVELLQKFFSPFNRQLQELLGDNHLRWGY